MADNLFFRQLNNYPSDSQTIWSEELQGVTHNADHWFISQKSRIWKIPVGVDLNDVTDDISRGIFNIPIPVELAVNYDHFGDLDFYNGYLFVGLENSSDNRTASIACFNADTLTFIGSDIVPSQDGHASWCAVNQSDGFLYSSAFDNVSELFAYQLTINSDSFELMLVDTIPLHKENEEPLMLSGIQGGVFVTENEETHLFLTSNKSAFPFSMNPNENAARGLHVFKWLDTGAMRVKKILIGTDLFTWGEEIEGITFWDLSDGIAPGINGQLHILELDNDSTHDDVKAFYHYAMFRSEYIANINPTSREVHHWECKWIDHMTSEHTVDYDTLEQAIADGFDGCHYCIGGVLDKR